MIHQFILAAPKPGLTDAEFQDYWCNVHAVKYASRIPQIKRYLVDTRIPCDLDLGSLPHQGIAEIWLENEEEQLASMQSEEFLDGARRDEPNWAAFWLTIGLDTTTYEVLAPPDGRAPDEGAPDAGVPDAGVTVTVLLKRRPGTTLEQFRRAFRESYAPLAAGLPGLRRYEQSIVRDGAYTFGEAPLDAVEQLWFDDLGALRAAWGSAAYTDTVRPAVDELVDPTYLASIVTREHWILR